MYGEAGTGKTNFAIGLIRQCAAAHLQSFYVSTFKPISRARLDQVRLDPNLLTIKHCSSLPEVDQVLFTDLPEALKRDPPIRLLVLDTVSGLVNEAFMDEGEAGAAARAMYLTRQVTVLKHLSWKHQFVFLAINTLASDAQGGVRPSLGLTWSNLVNDRFRLIKDQDFRRIHVIWSSECPPDRDFPFLITGSGISETR